MTNPYRSRTRVGLLDTAWLHMGTTPTQTPVGGIVLFADPVSIDELKQVVRARLLRLARFRRLAREPISWPLRPVWEEDPRFDLDAHVQAVTLPSPGDWQALKAFYEALMGVPLHPEKPLWQMHLVEQYGAGSALIIRFEHAVADGDAAMHILNRISDLRPGKPVLEPTSPQEQNAFLGAIASTYAWAGKAQSLPAILLFRDWSPRNLTRQGAAALRAFNKLVFGRPDPQTVLRGKRSTAHRLAVSEPISLHDVKAMGAPVSATVNDVILSAVAGGLRSYMADRGDPVDDLCVQGMVPVSLRSKADATNLGNGFGLDFLPLPLEIADPVERLREVKGRMDAIKDSPEAQVSYAVLHLLGGLPRRIQCLAVRFFTMKASASMTNVAGPAETRYLAGSRIEQIMFGVPHPGDLPLGMSIMSYDGTVLVVIDSDAGLIPNPEAIIAGFEADLTALRAFAKNDGATTGGNGQVALPPMQERSERPLPAP